MDVPESYKTAGLINLACGAFTAFSSLMVVLSLIWICIGVFWLVPAAAGGYQAWVGWQMYNGEPTPAAKNAAIAGIVGGFLAGPVLPALGSIFVFVQLGRDDVKGWLETHGVSS